MKKLLLSLFAVFTASFATAQTAIWEEDWSGWTEHVKAVLEDVNDNYTFTGTVTNTDGSFKSGTTLYDEALAGGAAPELLIAKNGGAFSAVVELGDKTGDMTLTFKSNKALTVTVQGGTIGENQGSGNDYSYPINATSATLTITFSNTLSSNARFDNVKLFQGEGKKVAGLSWGTSARTVTIDANDNVFPTLSNENNLPVTYASSVDSVATIDAEGVITLLAAGKTEISASFEGNDEYEASTVKYTLTVKPAPAPTQDVTVAEALAIIAGLEDNATTDQTYNVTGYVVGEPDFQRKDDQTLYGNVNFTMADAANGTELLTVYRAKNIGNENFTEETISTLKEGDKVVVFGKLQKYGSGDSYTPELKNCYLLSINGETLVKGIAAEQESQAVFDLSGRRVEKAQKGIYIVNGKKVAF